MDEKIPKEELSKFNKHFNQKYKSYKKYINDLNYVYFIIYFKGEILTNLFSEEDEEIILNISQDYFDFLISKYFKGDVNNFDNYINKNFEDKKIIYFENTDIKQRKTIDALIYKEISKNSEALFYVTHNDQNSPYHVHRIIEK